MQIASIQKARALPCKRKCRNAHSKLVVTLKICPSRKIGSVSCASPQTYDKASKDGLSLRNACCNVQLIGEEKGPGWIKTSRNSWGEICRGR